MLLRRVRLGPGGQECDVRLVGGCVTEVGDLVPATGEEVADERGVLLPGFVDSHLHLTQWASARQRVDVSGAASAREAVDLLVRTPGDVVTGQAFRSALWDEPPHKDLLEEWMPGRRVLLLSSDLHCLWLSPAMLDAVGLDSEDGLLRDESALRLLSELDTGRPVGEVDAAVAAAMRELLARGITGITDFEYADNRRDWLRRAAAAPLPVRVTTTTWLPWLDEAVARAEPTGTPLAPRLDTGPLKLMVDGSLNTRTAHCHDAYPGRDPQAPDAHGNLLLAPEELAGHMARAWSAGIETAAHAIGDRAATVVLDAFERVGGRGRIEHAQQLRPADVARLARPGLLASVQPQHAMADREVADRWWPDRESAAFPYGSLHRAGAVLRFGSDAPVSPPDPWAAIADAVWRTDDERPPWHVEQALPVAVALRAACGGRAGVRVGDRADLVLVAEHPAHCSNADLRVIPVLATYVEGERSGG
ncbi:MAG: Exoenzyme regulatory protein AepA precursor [Frankiales bacterium]|nr:Exoenzyme regulatory protein AepA precursor [Frankiales bacterium]